MTTTPNDDEQKKQLAKVLGNWILDYLEVFVLVGYTSGGGRFVITNAPSARDWDALTEFLRYKSLKNGDHAGGVRNATD